MFGIRRRLESWIGDLAQAAAKREALLAVVTRTPHEEHKVTFVRWQNQHTRHFIIGMDVPADRLSGYLCWYNLPLHVVLRAFMDGFQKLGVNISVAPGKPATQHEMNVVCTRVAGQESRAGAAGETASGTSPSNSSAKPWCVECKAHVDGSMDDHDRWHLYKRIRLLESDVEDLRAELANKQTKRRRRK